LIRRRGGARRLVEHIAGRPCPSQEYSFPIWGAARRSSEDAAGAGGLLTGLWLGFVVPPGKVPTLQSAWQHPRGEPAERSPLLIAAGVIALVALMATILAVGGATL
jgi:hypothetical protein